jgi:hypothetical protein
MFDEPAEKTFEQKRGETNTIELGLTPMPFDFGTGFLGTDWSVIGSCETKFRPMRPWW